MAQLVPKALFNHGAVASYRFWVRDEGNFMTREMNKLSAIFWLLPLLIMDVLNVPAAEAFKIEKALIGAKDTWQDITAFLQDNVHDGALAINLSQPFDLIGGDPAPGEGKKMIIDYQHNGASHRLTMEEEYPIAFTIRLPQLESAMPGTAPQVLTTNADVPANLPILIETFRKDWRLYLLYFACGASLLSLVGTVLSLLQIRRIKKELGKASTPANP